MIKNDKSFVCTNVKYQRFYVARRHNTYEFVWQLSKDCSVDYKQKQLCSATAHCSFIVIFLIMLSLQTTKAALFDLCRWTELSHIVCYVRFKENNIALISDHWHVKRPFFFLFTVCFSLWNVPVFHFNLPQDTFTPLPFISMYIFLWEFKTLFPLF